ncbi:ACP S-malonyltransferase [Rickettsiella grylli]|uniref:Malonyl CoA-acyl carrier protein transacylase n=1 Tax=Rickettsiella grylli TaxID=59196 RepID=A8PMK3_9COXI|nr:ACP S-malonyltransferase [Rickettsiella grylli]EDP45969.1 malonyl CoA-acyl carrier protein transacylase [Rickettsiella grylli]
MNKKIAFIFPGQGSQSLGMLAEFAKEYPLIQETFSQASQVLKFDLWKLCQEGPEAALNQTENTQPALLAASVALWRVWQQERGVKPMFMAGHSLGEYSALVCAGALDYLIAIRLVAERGRLMQAAVPAGTGAMAAIVGLDTEQLQALCDSVAEGQILAPANFNSIGQTVVTGDKAAVERLLEPAKRAGAKLAKRIPVSVPSHCALMKPAAEHLAETLQTIHINTPHIPVLNNVNVRIEQDPLLIKHALTQQLYSPVRWVEIIQSLEKRGIEEFIECGPGKVLTGLNKRITSIPTLPIHDPEILQEALMS